MNLTQEQISILDAKEDSFIINAVAGSGKTTTLLEYVKKHPDKKILYLAYNKSLQISLSQKLKDYQLSNLLVSTIHSLAYKKVGAHNYTLVNELKNYIIEETLARFELQKGHTYLPSDKYVTLVKDIINFYCNSSLVQIDEKLLTKYKNNTEVTAKTIDLINDNSKDLLLHVKHILSSMKTGKIDAIHDFYLKMFHLNNKALTSLNYDLILIDEAQDISDVMIAIIESQNCSKIYVGDSFQQIYSFRYASNALKKVKYKHYNLSYSFRFSDSYANTLRIFLNKFYLKHTDLNLKLRGLGQDTKIGKEFLDNSKPFTIIARTTFGLIQELINHIHKDCKFYFEGGYNSYSFMNSTVYSIYYLKEKKHEKISIDEIKEFNSIKELENHSVDVKNQDYLNIIKFVNEYGNNIFEINKKIKEKIVTNKEQADIVFTTTHKAKGLEYDQVILADDFITQKDIDNPKKNFTKEKIVDELNILYVALTRVKKVINYKKFNER